MEGKIRTVSGDVVVPPGGHVLMHEHTLIGWWGSEFDRRAQINQEEEVTRVAGVLADLKERFRLAAIVDASPPDMGRSIEFNQELTARSGVQVISATGFYKSGIGLPYYWRIYEPEDYAEWMTDEIDNGVLGQSGRCGVIKVSTTGGIISEVEEKALIAAAQAAVRTGASIITHTDPDGWEAEVGVAQLDLLMSHGVDADRIAIGHACGAKSVRPLLSICARGAFIAFDRIGSTYVRTDESRADMILELCSAGYVNQILLSHDHQGAWKRRRVPSSANKVEKDFSLIHTKMIPMLIERGIRSSEIDQIMSDNPIRLLALRTAF